MYLDIFRIFCQLLQECLSKLESPRVKVLGASTNYFLGKISVSFLGIKGTSCMMHKTYVKIIESVTSKDGMAVQV